ncbi:MAG: hypothetical protein FWF91_02670 [Coriobacteriia bacterium]|nr:hypothetical protein [Coriobacteriia bacterium]
MAVVRRETLEHPDASDDIQAICASCHLPMADMMAIATNQSRSFLDNAALSGHELNQLYQDGGSCMFCHQITSSPIDGNTAFRDTIMSVNLHQASEGQTRYLYGYHPSSTIAQQPMIQALGYSTEQSFVERNERICTVCHTLYTDSFTVDGQPTGMQLPEQVVALEWKGSDWGDNSCQSCHMPPVLDAGPFSNQNVAEATQGRISLHSFVGGNAYLLQLNGGTDGSLEKGVTATTEFLQSQTATLTLNSSIDETSGSGPVLMLDVAIDSQVGHKFPTGFPSRRAWIHVQVFDEAGFLIYESGGYNAEGMILDNNADLIKGAFEPHYSIIDQPGQVQIYESVMLDSDGLATTSLLQGVVYGKDNRILPIGFEKNEQQREGFAGIDKNDKSGDAAVVGEAVEDEDFVQGGDITYYRISLPADIGAVEVRVELLYQSVGYRFMEDLLGHPSPEQQILADLVKQHPNLPVLVAKQETKVIR